MPLPQVCVCYLIRTRDGVREVLLGRKKKGLGYGNYVAPGGKLEPGESTVEAMVREVYEETGLTVSRDDLTRAGTLTYLFPYKTQWSQQSTVFVCHRFDGVPVESDELRPEWFPLDEIPLDQMWDDARLWLPDVLNGGSVTGTHTFGSDLRSVVDVPPAI